MKIFDAHTHIFPSKIQVVATTAIRDFYDRDEMAHIGGTEELLEAGRAAGVTKYLVFSTATTPQQVTKINDFILSECEKYDEFHGAGTMHRDFDNFGEELERIHAAGLRGIKLHPDFQKFNIDDEMLFPMYKILEDRGMFMITHAGDSRYSFSHPSRVRHVAEKFPKLRIIAAHFGGWSQWDLGRKELVLPNVYVDTSSTYSFAGYEPIVEALSTFDRRHIFFGSDFPMWDPGDEIAMLHSVVKDTSLLEDILYNNFMEFYDAR